MDLREGTLDVARDGGHPDGRPELLAHEPSRQRYGREDWVASIGRIDGEALFHVIVPSDHMGDGTVKFGSQCAKVREILVSELAPQTEPVGQLPARGWMRTGPYEIGEARRIVPVSGRSKSFMQIDQRHAAMGSEQSVGKEKGARRLGKEPDGSATGAPDPLVGGLRVERIGKVARSRRRREALAVVAQCFVMVADEKADHAGPLQDFF